MTAAGLRRTRAAAGRCACLFLGRRRRTKHGQLFLDGAAGALGTADLLLRGEDDCLKLLIARRAAVFVNGHFSSLSLGISDLKFQISQLGVSLRGSARSLAIYYL